MKRLAIVLAIGITTAAPVQAQGVMSAEDLAAETAATGTSGAIVPILFILFLLATMGGGGGGLCQATAAPC